MASAESPDAVARRIAEKLSDLRALRLELGDERPPLVVNDRLDEAGLAELEARLGTALPEGYRAFARHVGTAGAGPDYGLLGAGVAMPGMLPQVTATVTTVQGESFSAGTGPRPATEGEPNPARPFLLAEAWAPVDEGGDPVEPPTPPGAHLYDGAMQLAEIGCGYFYFLVVKGPRAGEVWCDYSAGDGSIAPLGPFLEWYEGWVDDWLSGCLTQVLLNAMPPGEASPYDHFLVRWAEVLERRSERAGSTGTALGDLTLLCLYQRRFDEADAGIEKLEALPPAEVDRLPRGLRESLICWRYPEAAAAAKAKPPEIEPAVAHRSWRIRCMLAENAATPANALARLAHDPHSEVRYRVAMHPATDASVLSALLDAAEASWAERPDDREALFLMDLLARHPGASAALLERLAACDRTWPACRTAPWVVRGVAMNLSAPQPLLAALARHAHPCVREGVARAAGDPSLLATLASDPDETVRKAVASNASTAEASLLRLAREGSSEACYALTARPTLSAEVQAILACAPGSGALFSLGRRSDLSDEALALLRLRPDKIVPDVAEPAPEAASHDDGEGAGSRGANAVDFQIVGSGETGRPPFDDPRLEKRPRAALATIVTSRALGHPGYPAPLLTPYVADPDDMIAYDIAAHPWLEAETCRALVAASYSYTRSRLASRHDLEVDVLKRLFEDEAWVVHRALATRDDVPADRIVAWAHSPHEDSRSAAASARSAPPELLAKLARDPAKWTRRNVAINPVTPDALLTIALEDAELDVRKSLVWRPNVPVSVLDRLAADPEPEVRAWANWRRARDRLAAKLG